MKQEYIEALQWLFGESAIIKGYPDQSGFELIFEDLSYYTEDAQDNAYICALIDAALLQRKDVGGSTLKWRPLAGKAEWFFNIWDENGDESTSEAFTDDPLTARLEALTQLRKKT